MKAQVSIEFFLLFIIIISIFFIFLFFSIEIQRQTEYLSNYNRAALVSLRIGNAINNVISNGVNATIDIPYGYNISLTKEAVIVTEISTGTSSSWPIPHINVSSTNLENITVIKIFFANSTLYIS